METTLHILAAVIILGAFLPLLRFDLWIVRGWDFPQLQFFVVGMPVFVLLIATGVNGKAETGLLAVLGLGLLWMGWGIFHYTPMAGKRVRDGEGGVRLSVMVSNVLMSNRESGKLLELLRSYQPDIFVALETDQWWVDQLSEISADYQHSVELPQDDTYGMLVRSRIPLEDLKVEYLLRGNIPSVHCFIRLDDGTKIRVHALHPKPPFPDEDTSSTDRDAELLMVGKRVKEQGDPSIVLGDMNDVAWSHTTRLFQRTSGLLDPRIGRGFFSTFHAEHRWMRWPLDHMFISKEFRVCRIERLPYVGSDHFPMFAEFSYEPEKRAANDPLEEDAGDRKEADEKISDARKTDSLR